MNAFMGVILIGGAFIGNDLWFNKALNGEPLESSQVAYLFLDESYLAESDDGKMLTLEQKEAVMYRILMGAGLLALLMMASITGTGTYMAWIYQRINQGLRATMMRQAEHLSLQYHAHSRTGDAIYRVYQDSATITNVLQMLIITPLRAVGTAIFSVAVLSLFSPWLGLYLLLTIVPILWLLAKFTRRLQERSHNARQSSSDLTANIQEVFSAIRLIKANRAEKRVLQEFEKESNRALDAAFQFRWDIVLLTTSMMLVAIAALLFAEYWMAGWSRLEETTFLGRAIAFVGFASWNLGAFQSASARFADTNHHTNDFVSLWANAQDLSVGLDRAFFLLDLEPAVTDKENAIGFPEVIREVSWRGVGFSYDKDVVILRDLDLRAGAGTITAIVGNTGSGKSTLMSLLLRLYDPDSGAVWLNDCNIKDILLAELRNNIAIALQKNVLFTTSVAENISYASDNAQRADIVRAAEIACADEFIRAMPQGYDSELGERGGKLSSGQRQRLSIARALVRDTPILILDEPTASLDAETEHRVLANIRTWGRNRVVFLITHRLSTIRNADQIAFLEGGQILELGSHDELMARPQSRYRHFVEAEIVGAANE